ncbi:response regulator transcription factor [Paraburkholderia sp. SIMBA_054]|uniref:response regulator transcription factor n=1 Tax=Paraburkholderia sp. SIMBA_054 TaxID=3085795 RepID=UPI0039797DD7
MRILIAEDDARTSRILARGLTESGHIVDTTGDGATALALVLEGIYTVVVTDRRLPSLDGLEWVRRLRAERNATPVLMLSALASANDHTDGLRAGCDDYLAKPYVFAELLARVEALARRRDALYAHDTLRIGDLTIAVQERTATRGGRDLNLQRREFLLLECLARNARHVVTRSMLLEAAWPYEFEPRANVIDMHINRLRNKVDKGFPVALIHTVVGAGYVLKPDNGTRAP